MLKILLVAVFLMGLLGCTTITAVKRDAPTHLLEPCEQPELLNDKEDVTKHFETIVKNAGLHKECRQKVSHWIQWYNAK